MAIVDHIYDAIGDEQAFARLPAALAAEVGARSCMLQLAGPDGGLRAHLFSYWQAEQFAYFIDNGLLGIDEWRNLALTPAFIGRPFIYDDHVSPEGFLRSALFNDFFRVFGDDTARFMGATMPMRDQTLVIGLQRPARGRPFDRAELGRLEALIQHLRRMASARDALDRERAAAQDLAAALDAPQVGIARVNAQGRLIHANAAARAILEGGDGIGLSGSVVAVSPPHLRERFAQAMKTAARRSGGRGDALLVPRPSGEPSWRVHVVPDEADVSGCATVLIEATGLQRDRGGDLARLYDLTPAEAEVALLLAQGFSSAEIAERRAVSVHTVRTQAKTVLSKTGAARQAELAALLAGLGPRSGRR